jgi:hypothetical protein
MRILLILLINILLTSQILHSQDTAAFKRPAYKLTLAVDKATFYEQDIKSTPYILPENIIQLYPGETVYVEVDQENGIVKKILAVQAITDTSKTMTISFSQLTDGKNHKQTMLKVANPFALPLVYKAHIFVLSQKRWVTTDVYPVEPLMSGYETWPDLITSIALYDWILQKK